ncbi:MAG: tyrosine-type recombinase/integrase [Chloroflexi bacterium]|nr:tyrosine-type recombinase/integrase [Chloroflexota bacterium]
MHIRLFVNYILTAPARWGSNAPHAQRQAKASTADNYYRTLKAFFSWCVKEGLIPDSPLTNVKHPIVDQTIIPTYTTTDIQHMLDACPAGTRLGLRNRAIILTLLDSGLRAEELVEIAFPRDYNGDEGRVKVHGKGRKERTVRVGYMAQKAILKWLLVRPNNCDRLFTSEEGKPLTRSGLSHLIGDIGKQANITSTRCSPHTFRHTFAVNFLKNGGQQLDLKELLGHKTLAMIERYIRYCQSENAIEKHRQFSPADRMGLK